MAYNFSEFKVASEGILEWLKKEYTGLRTGRATPAILDVIQAESYGSKMPINQLATISVEGPRSIRVTPWDKSAIKSIDTAIRESNLGLSVAVDSDGLRVSFPELTADRRTGLVKVAKEKLEEARIRVRSEREKILSDLEKKEKSGELTKDERFKGKEDLQKLVDDINKKLEDLADRKEKEILE